VTAHYLPQHPAIAGLSDLGGIPDAVAELCLNHRQKGVAGVYDRAERLLERGRALQRWADRESEIAQNRVRSSLSYSNG